MPFPWRGGIRTLSRETERGVEPTRTPARCLEKKYYRPPRSGEGGVPKSDDDCASGGSVLERDISNNGWDARNQCDWSTTSMERISNSHSGWGASCLSQRLRSRGRIQAWGTCWTNRPHAGTPIVDSARLCQSAVVLIVNGDSPSDVTRT
jgi:hypothetical protein